MSKSAIEDHALAKPAAIDRQISALEDERCRAMVEADVDALSKLLDDELVWTHASAHLDDKASLLARIGSGQTRYLAIERSDEIIRHHGRTAIVSGLATMHATVAGAEHHLRNRYTDVWVQREAGWRMIGWQSTKLQDAA